MYTLIGNIQAIELVKNGQAKIVYEFSENEATAYLLKDGKVIILPSEGDSSMLFQSIKEFNLFKAAPKFPEPTNELFYRYKDHIQAIKASVDYFYTALSKALNKEIAPLNSDQDLIELFKKLNEVKQRDFIVPLGVVIGDYLVRKYKLRWKFNRIYTFIVYDIPNVESRQGFAFGLWKLLDEYATDKNFDGEDFMEKFNIFRSMAK